MEVVMVVVVTIVFEVTVGMVVVVVNQVGRPDVVSQYPGTVPGVVLR